MNQTKVGAFLKELRKEKGVTQEQLAERMNVSTRSVSRWETGNNMPDLDILIELADYYDVEIGEILDGERKSEKMNETEKENLIKVSNYSNEESRKFNLRLHILSWISSVALIFYFVMEEVGLTDEGITAFIAAFALGLVLGMNLVGIFITSRFGAKLRNAKLRAINKLKDKN